MNRFGQSPGMPEELLYLEPIIKEYIWGKETWVLSSPEKEFPLLIKLIDARESLSVQVHPGDNYAWAQEGSQGKTEMWYILDHEPGAFLYYGLKHKVTENEIRKRLKNGSILEICQKVPVKKGEVFYIAPGMLHAIGKGIRLVEVQQNSDITYRVYDYEREDAEHHKRQLHVDQALEVMGFVPAIAGQSPLGQREKRANYSRILLAYCPYFAVWSYKIDGSMELAVDELCGNSQFLSVVVLRGLGTVNGKAVKQSDSIYVPKACSQIQIDGRMELLMSIVPEQR